MADGIPCPSDRGKRAVRSGGVGRGEGAGPVVAAIRPDVKYRRCRGGASVARLVLVSIPIAKTTGMMRMPGVMRWKNVIIVPSIDEARVYLRPGCQRRQRITGTFRQPVVLSVNSRHEKHHTTSFFPLRLSRRRSSSIRVVVDAEPRIPTRSTGNPKRSAR